MQIPEQIVEHTLNLLSSSDLVKAAAAVAEILQEMTGSPIAAVIMWDPDLEMLRDRFVFGPNGRGFETFVNAFCDEFKPNQEETLRSLADCRFSIALPAGMDGLICWQARHDDRLSACILFVPAAGQDPQLLKEKLSVYPISRTLAHIWDYRELEAENERLRNNYEELEDKTSLLEEQTRKLIHDLTARDSIRTKHVERERLVYSIANAVRSYVDIRKVLEATVERIGTTFSVSRCLLLRPIETSSAADDNIYEFLHDTTSVKEIFSSEEGQRFVRKALERTTPQDMSESDLDKQELYDPSFLRKQGLKSGLLVPLVLRERVLGVLFLQDCKEPRPWSIDDISLIGSLADQVSVAIENAELHLEKERQAVTDGLTGIANRRGFNDGFAREFERAWRYRQPLSLVLIDLDFLKVINDTFGHQMGDEAIKQIGWLLKQSSRAVDIAARFGGDEFCLLLPNTDLAMAEQLSERLLKLISEVHIEGPGHISASFGISSYPAHADDPDALFRLADEALYEAKQAGRNVVKVATIDPNYEPRYEQEGANQEGERNKQRITGNRLKAAKAPESESKENSSVVKN
jgi:diguanylate cyclase (GGDEF)-like protein